MNVLATAVTVLNNFGIDGWNARVYGSLSLASQVSIMVKTRAQAFRVSYLLWKLNSNVNQFFLKVDDILSGKIVCPPSAEPITPQQFTQGANDLLRLGLTLNGIYENARRQRLTNNSLIAGPATALRAHADHFFEMAEWFESLAHRDELERVFANAQEERQRGDVFELSQVE